MGKITIITRHIHTFWRIGLVRTYCNGVISEFYTTNCRWPDLHPTQWRESSKLRVFLADAFTVHIVIRQLLVNWLRLKLYASKLGSLQSLTSISAAGSLFSGSGSNFIACHDLSKRHHLPLEVEQERHRNTRFKWQQNSKLTNQMDI